MFPNLSNISVRKLVIYISYAECEYKIDGYATGWTPLSSVLHTSLVPFPFYVSIFLGDSFFIFLAAGAHNNSPRPPPSQKCLYFEGNQKLSQLRLWRTCANQQVISNLISPAELHNTYADAPAASMHDVAKKASVGKCNPSGRIWTSHLLGCRYFCSRLNRME